MRSVPRGIRSRNRFVLVSMVGMRYRRWKNEKRILRSGVGLRFFLRLAVLSARSPSRPVAPVSGSSPRCLSVAFVEFVDELLSVDEQFGPFPGILGRSETAPADPVADAAVETLRL